MAPMIDMVFLLLVFFMTVSTLAKEARPETELPLSESASVPSAAPPRDIISILPGSSGYQLFWYNSLVEEDKLAALIKDGEKGGSAPGILLRGPPEAPWSEFERIMEVLRETGVHEVTLATFEN